MPAFFVHGVPDTAAEWDAIRTRLDRTDVLAPNLPGFDAPVPSGFGATKEEYVDWLIAAIGSVGEPVDLVGHDWGSILVQRAVSRRPDLIRTWAAGGATVDRDYVWHDIAQAWQAPGIGEQVMEGLTADALAEGLADELGGRDRALAVGSRVDDTMKDCILKLYRSAASGFGEWHDDVDRVLPTRPGAVFWGMTDAYVSPDFGERLASRTHAKLHMYECGHWWPVLEPAAVAAALQELWATPER
jgi:pimeloyl-ACP methyl ester carboxylesterase